MDSIIIKPTKPEELEFLKSMALKMGFGVTIISEEDQEDFGLLKAMEEAKNENNYVAKEEIINKLKSISVTK